MPSTYNLAASLQRYASGSPLIFRLTLRKQYDRRDSDPDRACTFRDIRENVISVRGVVLRVEFSRRECVKVFRI